MVSDKKLLSNCFTSIGQELFLSHCFQDCALSLIFRSLIMMCVGVDFFVFYYLFFSQLLELYLLPKYGKSSASISSDSFLAPVFSPSGTDDTLMIYVMVPQILEVPLIFQSVFSVFRLRNFSFSVFKFTVSLFCTLSF